jgi:hypothetical protein
MSITTSPNHVVSLPIRGEKAGVFRETVYFEIVHPESGCERLAPARLLVDTVKAAEAGGTQLKGWHDYAWQPRETASQAVVDVEWDGAHQCRLLRIVYFVGRIDVDCQMGQPVVGAIEDMAAFRTAVERACCRRLREGWFGEYQTDTFRTSDGYTLTIQPDGRWGDGDHSFMAHPKSGWPCEVLGEPLDGQYVEA